MTRPKEPEKIKVEYLLAKEFKEEYPELISVIGVLMNRINNVYTVDENLERNIQTKVEEWNLANNNRWVKKMLEYLVTYARINEAEFFCHEEWIVPFQNGYFDAQSNEFKQFHEKKFFYEIPHLYNDKFEGDCLNFKAMLKKYLSDQHDVNVCNVDDIFEIMGYCMTMNTNLKKAVYIFGPTQTGKTTFQTILLHLIGDKNTANISLWRMQKDQFGTDGLQLKILNTTGETSNSKIPDVSYFKQLTGADKWIAVEPKGGKKGRFINHVKLLMMGNKLAQLVDKNDQAFYDRWIIVNFAHVFKVSRDKYSDFVIFDPNEVQGIIHESLKGLNRLYNRGEFRPELIQNNRHIWNYNTDNFYRFIHDKCVIDWEKNTTTQTLYRTYVSYVVDNKLGEILTEKAITAELKNYEIYMTSHYEGKKRIYEYEGIRFKDKKEVKKELKEVKKLEKLELNQPEFDYETSYKKFEDDRRAEAEMHYEGKTFEQVIYDTLSNGKKAMLELQEDEDQQDDVDLDSMTNEELKELIDGIEEYKNYIKEVRK